MLMLTHSTCHLLSKPSAFCALDRRISLQSTPCNEPHTEYSHKPSPQVYHPETHVDTALLMIRSYAADTSILVPMFVRLEQVFEQMQAASIRPETALYAAVIDLLWMSGIVGAQQRAQQLFQLACRQSVRGMEAAQAATQEANSQLEVTH